jgi:CheY-like chemotaxis protein
MPADGFDRGVIVADDSALIRDNVRIALGESWRVFVAANGIEAVQFAHNMRAALVLLDVHMPRMDGLVACARIRALPRYDTTPIVMLTGYADAEMCRRALQAGATRLIRKPFTIGRLRADLALLLSADVKAKRSGQAARPYPDDRPEPAPSADTLTRNQEILGVCRDSEVAIGPGSYAEIVAVKEALRLLDRR